MLRGRGPGEVCHLTSRCTGHRNHALLNHRDVQAHQSSLGGHFPPAVPVISRYVSLTDGEVMPQPARSEEQLRSMAEEHLRYEVWMLHSTAQELAKGVPPGFLHNVLLESFTIHLRAVIDFLWPPANLRSDDATARDFFAEPDDWSAVSPPFPDVLEPTKLRTGKEIAHLTYTRLEVTRDAKRWDFIAMANAALAALRVFVDNAAPERIGGLAGVFREASG